MWFRLGAVLLLALILAPSAEARRPRLTVSPAAAEPGDRVVLTGRDFAPRTRLRVTLAGHGLRRARTGSRGRFRIAFRVPERASGRYRLTVRVGRRVLRRRFSILPRPALPPPAPPSPSPPPPVVAAALPPPDPPTLVAAGDIACRPGLPEAATACRQARTAALVASLAPDAVAVLGDNQYEHGELANFAAVYEPTWGTFKSITYPAVGNHEHEGDPQRDEAPGYYAYFGDAAGDPLKGYYRWELGGWSVFVLNSGAINWTRATGGNPSLQDDCWPVSCAAGSTQEQWLRAELATLPDEACVLAYWHHPRFSSGFSGLNQPHVETEPLFDALYDHGAELILTAHSHNYERFEPLDATGSPDPQGITQFVVGTGGRSLHTNTGPPQTTTLRTDVFGVLELTLEPNAWSARFLAENGETIDEAAAGCHGSPGP